MLLSTFTRLFFKQVTSSFSGKVPFLKSKQYNLKFQCKHCSYSTDKKCHFTYHERLHSVSNLYKCIYCPETSKHNFQHKHSWVQTKKST